MTKTGIECSQPISTAVLYVVEVALRCVLTKTTSDHVFEEEAMSLQTGSPFARSVITSRVPPVDTVIWIVIHAPGLFQSVTHQ
jgi:hypothetical protein